MAGWELGGRETVVAWWFLWPPAWPALLLTWLGPRWRDYSFNSMIRNRVRAQFPGDLPAADLFTYAGVVKNILLLQAKQSILENAHALKEKEARGEPLDADEKELLKLMRQVEQQQKRSL